MSIVVQLTDLEALSCRLIGNMKTISSRTQNVKDRQMGKQEAYETDEDGMIGEYAFCKHYNIFLDVSLSPRSGSYDCMYKSKRIDIKTTRLPNGRLIATTKKNPDVDIFVLAIVEGNKVTFPGYALASELYNESKLTNLGHGETYTIEQQDLRQWK
jgi:hypothetical protein